MIKQNLVDFDDREQFKNICSGWIVLDDQYYLIHPYAYKNLDKYFDSKFEEIITLSETTDEKDPYYKVGIEYFKNNFDYILDYYYTEDKKELYEWINCNKEAIFFQNIPIINIGNLNFQQLVRISESKIFQYVSLLNSKTNNAIIQNYILLLIQKELKVRSDILCDDLVITKSMSKIPPLVNVFKDRYSCECGQYKGLIAYHNNVICNYCNTKVKYRDIL